jgi:hypothetical protein
MQSALGMINYTPKNKGYHQSLSKRAQATYIGELNLSI